MSTNGERGGATILKGLRLVTMDRGPEGFGFHMYTNKTLKGQYIKSVAPNGPADLSGMLPGDHVLAIDGVDIQNENHHQVVERIRKGDGVGKKVLVIDAETEKEMEQRNEKIEPDKAIVMIPRTSIKVPSKSEPVEETDSGPPQLKLGSMEDALLRGARKKQDVKTRGWKESVQAYNQL